MTNARTYYQQQSMSTKKYKDYKMKKLPSYIFSGYVDTIKNAKDGRIYLSNVIQKESVLSLNGVKVYRDEGEPYIKENSYVEFVLRDEKERFERQKRQHVYWSNPVETISEIGEEQ
ncbi:MAG: hypothetical protein QM632_05275 [Micrococcaceae bacterium]